MIFKRLAATVFFLLAPFMACAADSARLLYFDDSVDNRLDMAHDVDSLIADSTSHIQLDAVDREATFMRRDAFMLSGTRGFDPKLLPEATTSFIVIDTAAVLETPYSAVVQYPVADNGFYDALLARHPGKKPLLRKGSVIKYKLADGRAMDAVVLDDRTKRTEWLPVSVVNYSLTIDGKPTTVKVYSKYFGGFGAFYDILRQEKRKTPNAAVIDFGYLYQYENVLSTDTIAAYWRETGVDIVTTPPSDFPIFWKMLPSSCPAAGLPDFVFGNLTVPPQYEACFKKYVVRQFGKVKVGIFSLLEPSGSFHADFPQQDASLDNIVPTAAALVHTLRAVEKVDAVVLLARLNDDRLSMLLDAVPGIDVVLRNKTADRTSSKKNVMELRDWNTELHSAPALVAKRNAFSLGDITLDFDASEDGPQLSKVTDANSNDLLAESDLSNDYYRRLWKLLDNTFSSKDYLLPDHRRLYGTPAYTPEEYFTLAAEALRSAADAEAAFYRLRYNNLGGLGRPSESIITHWLAPDAPTHVGLIKGSDLKNLMNYVVFPSSSAAQDTTNRLAVAGVDRDGSINGVAIRDSEYYKVALPEDLLRADIRFPQVRSFINLRPLPFSSTAVTLDWLRARRRATQNLATSLSADYMKHRLDRIKNNLPPTTDEEAMLDNFARDKKVPQIDAYFLKKAIETQAAGIRAILDGTRPQKPAWRINLKELSLLYSNTSAYGTQEYSSISNAKLVSDGQMLVRGKLKLFSELSMDKLQNDTGVTIDYGKTILRPSSGDSVETETADSIVTESEVRYKQYRLQNFLSGITLGPFFNLAYDTEFTGDPRRKIVRGKGGYKLFEGSVLKDFYMSAVTEQDFTYGSNRTKYGWETGASVEYPVAANVTASGTTYFRNMLRTPSDISTDLLTEFSAEGKLAVAVYRDLTFGPYFTYYRVLGKFMQGPASNTVVGVSLGYSFLAKPIF